MIKIIYFLPKTSIRKNNCRICLRLYVKKSTPGRIFYKRSLYLNGMITYMLNEFQIFQPDEAEVINVKVDYFNMHVIHGKFLGILHILICSN